MNFFKDNINKYQEEDSRLSKLFNQISTIRIVAFIIFLILAVYVADIPNAKLLGIVIILFLISFVILVKWHNRVKHARNHVRHLKKINEDEIKRLEGDLSSFEEGTEFITKDHYYASDIDVFGRNSLFQLLNRCTTITGKEKLANWLLHPAEKATIEGRQQAVLELKETPEFCQNLQAVGMHYDSDKVNINPLMNWLEEPNIVRTNRTIVIASYVLPTITFGLLVGIGWFGVPLSFSLIILIVNGFFLRRVFQYSLKLTEQTNEGVSTLSAITQLVKQVEKTQYSSELLTSIRDSFSDKGELASDRIGRLAKILDFLNNRANMLYAAVNFLLLLDIHIISRAEKWKLDNKDHVKLWFDRISEFEALSSIGRFTHANPDFNMPSISEKDYTFKAVDVSHPLIKSHERIGNDFEATQQGGVMIVTGSNMSGKSTFLRTIGVNIILGLAGAPVSAQSMKLSRILLFTSMRTQDNLEEHISSFYAELKRIKQLLHAVKDSDIPVMYMLDEILKGTNSHDRHKGGLAIVKQLHNSKSFGFVSTHDIELGKEAEKMDYCTNYHFSSEVNGNEISFDYKISTGICQSFNATALMRSIGIEME
jgi:hypothetical protein